MDRKRGSCICFSALILFTFIYHTTGVAIMSVDFGSEWMKIAVVAPGVPMEIALNAESKRKTPVAVAFREGERTFGEDAINKGMKSPESSFFYILDLLGKKIDNPIVLKFQERFPYYKIESDPVRATVVFRIDEETTYSVEELVSQLLNYAKESAMAHTNQKIKDVVITVPPFFNQAERRSVLAAAEICGLKVLSLMSTNAAVALNYGMFRRKEINETAENILFYDMGASSTIATVGAYQTIKTKDSIGYTETNPQVSILGMGYDRTLGGIELQLKLRDFLANKFNEMKKTTKDAFKSSKAMGKFLKEAGKLLKVLSANQEHLCQIEGVLDDQDFRLKVTRQEFEDMSLEFFARIRRPIDDALASAQIDISEIHQFIIVGGATRIPKLQSILQSIWGQELGKNINADEAAALGAVYRAADLGQGFKVLKFHVKESTVFPIDVDFEREIHNEDGTITNKVVKRSLFSKGSLYPQKKVMTFNKHTTDFKFGVNYGDLSHLSINQNKAIGSRNISKVSVKGVTEVFKKELSEEAEPKGIKAHFHMDDSGILHLSAVEAIFEKNVTVEVEKEQSTLSKIGSTLSNLFSSAEDEKINATETEDTKEKDTESEKNKTLEDGKEKTNGTEGDGKEYTHKLVVVKEELKEKVKFMDHEVIDEDAIKVSKAKLQAIESVENARKEKEQSRNNLESYIIDIQVKFDQDEYLKASKKEDREKILALAKENEEWIYDEGFDELPSVYQDRIKSMQKLFEPIRNRVREHTERPEALKALNNMINMSSTFFQAASNAPEEARYFTDVELKTLDELIINAQKWIEEKETEQEPLELSDDPKFTLMSIAEKIQEMDREVKYMVNKARLAKAKKDKEMADAKFKADKEAEKAAKKRNKTKNANASSSQDTVEETILETILDDGDSRKEPPMPTMVDREDEASPDLHEGGTEENEEESDHRKDGQTNLDDDQLDTAESNNDEPEGAPTNEYNDMHDDL